MSPVDVSIDARTVLRRRSRGRATRATMLVASMVAVVAGCSRGAGTLCDAPASVAGYVIAFDQGLGNLEADQFLGLRVETIGVRATLDLVLAEDAVPPEVRSAATELDDLIGLFATGMDSVDWDISRGLLDEEIVRVVDRLASDVALATANIVEALVIERCGLPPIVPRDPDTADSLPAPSVAPPTATDPPTDTIDERNEARSLGTIIGESFGLTLDDADVVCLGLALEGVYDASGSATSPEKYQQQFQSAFDRCEIDFTVPG